MADRYRAPSPATLRVVPLDALTLLYHRASGITHLVDTPVPELLAALGDDTLDVGALLARLCERYDLADADPGALVARLEELVAAGVVERT